MKIKLNGTITGFRETSEGTDKCIKTYNDYVITDVVEILEGITSVEDCCPRCEVILDIIKCLENIIIASFDNTLETTYKVCHEDVEGGIVVDIATTYHY